MRDIQKLERLVQEPGERYSIANLRMPAHGAVGLRLKEGTELYLEHDGAQGTLYAYTPVTSVPGDEMDRLRLFEKMLQLSTLIAVPDAGRYRSREAPRCCMRG
ncbi:MAG: hypothetical protein ACREX0_00755 [Noviherbaspirillum sp.]